LAGLPAVSHAADDAATSRLAMLPGGITDRHPLPEMLGDHFRARCATIIPRPTRLDRPGGRSQIATARPPPSALNYAMMIL
jgi:hypothetical protein